MLLLNESICRASAHANAINLSKFVLPFSAVVASSIEEVTSSIADKSDDAKETVAQWNLPTQKIANLRY